VKFTGFVGVTSCSLLEIQKSVLTKYYKGNQIKDSKMGETFSIQGKVGCSNTFVRKTKVIWQLRWFRHICVKIVIRTLEQ